MHAEIVTRLKEAGHRITPSRQAILEVLGSATQPVTQADVLRQLVERGKKADKVTVYRELAFLEEQGIVTPIQLNDRAKRYELVDLDHHHHLVCIKCDKVEDVDVNDDFAQAEKTIKKRTGFNVLRHSLEFFGTCSRCS